MAPTSYIRSTVVLLATAILANGCLPPDCERVDLGTCVNACCKLQFSVPSMDAKALAMKIADSIAHGGPDGRYLFPLGNVVQPWIDDSSFVVQAIHETAKHLYNDTIHFATETTANTTGATLHAFSHSQDFIKDNFAYGDHGQNYKNIIQLVKALGVVADETTIFGCPKPTN
eukprot:m.260002 g.260002  ORF g.260002 m.260002 type:complete len:172 (-) comp39040_c0_seq1:304-819(-)